MDIAKSLVKCVARAFYDTKHILVLDALMIHNAVRDDELCKLLGLQIKDLHKLCGKLKEDRMLAVHTRPEQKEGQQRPVNRTYYFVDFRATIDAVKFRMHGIVKDVEKKMNKDASAKGYACPRCSKRFTILEAMTLDRDDGGLFICERCESVLVEDDDSVESKTSQERLGRLMEQTKKIVEFLKKIDEVVVPPNDFDTAIANCVPVPKDKNQLAAAQFVPVNPTAKKAANSNQPNLEISITNASEKSAAELEAEKARRLQQAEKNALPVWHTQSTVDGPGATAVGAVKEEVVEEVEVKAEEEGLKPDAIEQYYALLAQQKAQEEEEEEDEDEDDDDEDDEDEEFEEVVVPETNNTSTTNTTTAVADDEEEDEARPNKKIKTESPLPMEEDSEEEVDFEDVS